MDNKPWPPSDPKPIEVLQWAFAHKMNARISFVTNASIRSNRKLNQIGLQLKVRPKALNVVLDMSMNIYSKINICTMRCTTTPCNIDWWWLIWCPFAMRFSTYFSFFEPLFSPLANQLQLKANIAYTPPVRPALTHDVLFGHFFLALLLLLLLFL